MLDDKLREILKQYWIFESSKPDETIAQIHKAFKDEGYIYIPTLTKGVYNHSGRSFIKINENEVMTGAEWYARFVNELPPNNVTADDQEYIEAAKRAAGIGE